MADPERQTCGVLSQRQLTPHRLARARAAAQAVRAYIVNHDFPPTLGEIGQTLNVTEGGAYHYLADAVRLGLLRDTGDRVRHFVPSDVDHLCPVCGLVCTGGAEQAS
ncbi:MAG: hypothetical protein ACRENL_00810 [Candidatus Dormibacteria bacterium]